MQIHIVQKGDTLYRLAQEYGVDLETLIRMNPQIADPEMIMPGMKIQIPSERMPIHDQTKTPPQETKIRKEQAAERVRPMEDIQLDEQENRKMKEPNKEARHNQMQGKTLGQPRVVRPHAMPQTPNQQALPNTIVYYCCCCKNHTSFMEQMNSSFPPNTDLHHDQQRRNMPNKLEAEEKHMPYHMQRNDSYFHEGGNYHLS